MAELTDAQRLERQREFERVLDWLARWGYSLVDSDGNPIGLFKETQLKHYYKNSGA